MGHALDVLRCHEVFDWSTTIRDIQDIVLIYRKLNLKAVIHHGIEIFRHCISSTVHHEASFVQEGVMQVSLNVLQLGLNHTAELRCLEEWWCCWDEKADRLAW
ncbi:hypothetical protein D9M70_366280 [compost metagenome]